MPRSIYDIIEEAFMLEARGVSRADILARFPEHRGELEALLETASIVKSARESIVPRREFRDALGARLRVIETDYRHTRVPMHRFLASWSIRALAGSAIAILFLVLMSRNAGRLPGELSLEHEVAPTSLGVPAGEIEIVSDATTPPVAPRQAGKVPPFSRPTTATEGALPPSSPTVGAPAAFAPQANIRLMEPQLNDAIGLPLVLRGEARVFENNFLYRLRDEDGTVLVENFDTAQAPDVGEFGPFEVHTSYRAPKGNTGTLEVFSNSAKDGSEINKVIVPIRFKKVEVATVQVYFSSQTQDPEMLDCARVFPALRRIPKTVAVARAALEELIKGPTINEGDEGFRTSINSGAKINSLTIQSGIARADFDETLQFQVGGSCRVTSIRSQIEKTLKQFSTVQSVIISIDGRTEDILQP